MTTVLLDSHVLHWWSAEPQGLSPPASRAIEQADELAVAAITWYELAWLAEHERIQPTVPVLSWLQQLSESFPGDPADRLIYATVEHGWRLVTKDRRLRTHRHPRPVAVW